MDIREERLINLHYKIRDSDGHVVADSILERYISENIIERYKYEHDGI